MSIKATINVFDGNFVLGDTIRELGSRFALGDLTSTHFRSADRISEEIERTYEAIVQDMVHKKIGRRLRDGSVEIFGTGGLVLGDDLSDIKVRVVGHHVDHGSMALNDMSYDLEVEIPDSVLEEL